MVIYNRFFKDCSIVVEVFAHLDHKFYFARLDPIDFLVVGYSFGKVRIYLVSNMIDTWQMFIVESNHWFIWDIYDIDSRINCEIG